MTATEQKTKFDFTSTREMSSFRDQVMETGNLAQAAWKIMEEDGSFAFQKFIHNYRAPAESMPSTGALTILEDHTVVARDGDQYVFMWQDRSQDPPRMVTEHSRFHSCADMILPDIPAPRFQGEPVICCWSHADLIQLMLLSAEQEAAAQIGADMPGEKGYPGMLYSVTDLIRQIPEILEAAWEETHDGGKTYEDAQEETMDIARKALLRMNPETLEHARELVREMAAQKHQDPLS